MFLSLVVRLVGRYICKCFGEALEDIKPKWQVECYFNYCLIIWEYCSNKEGVLKMQKIEYRSEVCVQ